MGMKAGECSAMEGSEIANKCMTAAEMEKVGKKLENVDESVVKVVEEKKEDDMHPAVEMAFAAAKKICNVKRSRRDMHEFCGKEGLSPACKVACDTLNKVGEAASQLGKVFATAKTVCEGGRSRRASHAFCKATGDSKLSPACAEACKKVEEAAASKLLQEVGNKLENVQKVTPE